MDRLASWACRNIDRWQSQFPVVHKRKTLDGPGSNPEILILSDGFALRGTINYGRGESEVEFKNDLDSFSDLARVMMEADKMRP